MDIAPNSGNRRIGQRDSRDICPHTPTPPSNSRPTQGGPPHQQNSMTGGGATATEDRGARILAVEWSVQVLEQITAISETL